MDNALKAFVRNGNGANKRRSNEIRVKRIKRINQIENNERQKSKKNDKEYELLQIDASFFFA